MVVEPVRIHDVHDFDAAAAAEDLLRHGIVAIDDVTERLHECAEEELLEVLGHVADELEIRRHTVDTPFGRVFVLRDAARITAREATRRVRDA